MPLVDLLDVPKHDPVTASEILRDPLSSHGGHITLWEGWVGASVCDASPGRNLPSPRSPGCRGACESGREEHQGIPYISPGERERAGPGLGRKKGATSTICPKSSTYIFSVSTSSLRTYLGREQVKPLPPSWTRSPLVPTANLRGNFKSQI